MRERFRFAIPKGHSKQVDLRRISWKPEAVIEGRGREWQRVEMGRVEASKKSEGAASLMNDGGMWQKRHTVRTSPACGSSRAPKISSQKCSLEPPPQHSWSLSLSKEVKKDVMEVPSHSLYPPSSTSISVSAGNY